MAPDEQVLDPAGEAEVTALEETIAAHLLWAGRSVAVHDTLLVREHLARWLRLADHEDAARAGRRSTRGPPGGLPGPQRAPGRRRRVDPDVIRRMHTQQAPTWAE